MRSQVRWLLLVVAGTAVGGCASANHHAAATQPSEQAGGSKTLQVAIGPPARVSIDPRSLLPLDEVPPRPTLWAPATTGNTDSDDPPIEALQLFAQGRIAMLDNERFTAINLLEKAAALDPKSFQIQEFLGKLYQGTSASDERSIGAFEQAAAINPDRLDLQINLGRQYIAAGKTDEGIRHLLLGIQTSGYRSDQSSAAEAELFLSTALQQEGYDTAALTLLERLAARLNHARIAIRARPALLILLEHPEEIQLRIGQLHQKLGNNEQALAAFTSIADADPDNLEIRQRIVQVLAAMGRRQDALQLASDLVVRHQARDPSVTILRQAVRDTGGDLAASEQLGKLYASHPGTRALLFAQIRLLRSIGRPHDAEAALRTAVLSHPDDLDLALRQLDLSIASGDRPTAARLVLEATARHPDWAPEIGIEFRKLLPGTTSGHLRLEDIQTDSKSMGVEPSRLYWTARWCAFWHRDGIGHEAIERASGLKPVFRPAFRERLYQIWDDAEAAPPGGADPAEQLAALAGKSNAGVAAELRGLIASHAKSFAQAVALLGSAMSMPGADAETAIEYARALLAAGDETGFKSAMWKLLSDHPAFDAGYAELHEYYETRGASAMADRVLSTWLNADAENVSALRLQARDYFRANRPDAAEAILWRLLNQHPDDPDVLETLAAFFTQTSRPAGLLQKLDDRLARDPGNFAIVTVLSQLYGEAGRTADAAKILDGEQVFARQDVELLYSLSGLYGRIAQKDSSERLLRTILQLEPAHAAASNDLGYLLSDDNRDLADAESLVRKAVNSEPFNLSFLDSMGWVLYKRGRFEEARGFLERAASPGEQADPVVLNHLGDNAYRLGDKTTAARSWKRAADRMLLVTGEERDDLKGLGQLLMQKQQQLQRGQTVNVAPLATSAAPPPPQAKK